MIIGIGNDLVDCRRIEALIQRHGSRFLDRVFTLQEQKRMKVRTHQAAGYGNIYAMKEATLKALGTGLAKGITWQDVEIFRESFNAPTVALYAKAHEILKTKVPEGFTTHIHMTASDEWPYAHAFAMISATPVDR